MAISSNLAPALLQADQARVRVQEARGRLVLSLWAQTYPTRQALVLDLRKAFPGHGDRCWRKADGTWSFPLRHRGKLMAWVACWFDDAAISWSVRLPEQPDAGVS